MNQNNLTIIPEIFSNSFQPIALDILGLLSILSGIFVIISKNPILSVLFLISLFLNISAYLILIGVHFIGLAYLVVYVSAVSMLFLFVVMLINVRTSELHSNANKGIPLGLMVSIAFYLPVYNIVWSLKPKLDSDIDVQFLTSNKWDIALVVNSDISSIGNILYSSHAIWLILTGIILLLALLVLLLHNKNN